MLQIMKKCYAATAEKGKNSPEVLLFEQKENQR